MSQEAIFSDFSAGMNASVAVDKLDPKECLLAENVRLDETGNILSAGAYTHQNTSAFAAAGGTNTNYVHSLFWNPSLGAVAGVGQDVFTGLNLRDMGSALAGSNPNNQKMSFGSAYNRVYFDVGNVGYWTDLKGSLLTVDWPPPIAVGATVTSSFVGTATQTPTAPFGTNTWTNVNNITSTLSSGFASIHFGSSAGDTQSEFMRATMTTNSFSIGTAAVTGIGLTIVALTTSSRQPLGSFQAVLLKAGIPVGSVKPMVDSLADGVFTTYSFGGSSDLWDSAWAQADINSPTFGFQLQAFGVNGPGNLEVYGGKLSIYQGSGFVAGTGTAGVLSGTYTWKITFVDNQGEESDASGDSNSIVLATQQGTLTSIPLGDARTTARNIYRKGGLLTVNYLVGTIQDNLSSTYSDNQTDLAALQTGVILAGDIPGDYPNTRFNNALSGALNAPSGNGRFPTLHYDRIFWINPNKPNQVYWSKPLNGFAYPAVNFTDVGDGKPVTRLVSIFGELIIFKTDSIWRLTGTDESSFQLTQTPSAVGTDMPFTIVAQPDKIMFTNRWGMWIFNGYTSQPLTTKLDLWFKQDDRTGKSLFGVNGFHPLDVTATVTPTLDESVGNSEKYILAYVDAGGGFNQDMLFFDLKRGNITKRVENFPLSLAIDPVTGYVYMGDTSGFISLTDDWTGATQGGSAGNLDFQMGYVDVARGSNKAIWALEFYLNTNGQSITPYVYYDNGASSETLAAISTTSLQRVVRPLEATGSRKAQNFSVRLNGSINPINVSGTPQIQVVHIKALYDIRTGRARTGQ